ncbi:PQQ-binding-like beta-propeller repeat protein [Labilibaculum manganireducens]|uniref:outer membrane protein assembly factor BamB family protein n=1 Tax=Labilibaculum manganireducens TaxID=1940525 RepID=UPI0029F53BEE|nr:PQQ-binding-like beta-propeller repeat protein [Labilibaculum manganireducens]
MSKIKSWSYNMNTLSNTTRRFYLVVTILFCVSLLPAKSQENSNTMLKLIKSHYNLRARVLHVEKVNEARWVFSNNERYVGHFNLSGRTESSNLVLSNDTMFVSKRDTIICFNGKTGEKYWVEKYKNRSNGEMLNTKSNIILTDYRAFKGICKRTGKLVWTTEEYNIRTSKYNKQKDFLFLSKDSTTVGLDAASGEKKWEYKSSMPFYLLMTQNDFLIGKSKDTLLCISINSKKIIWKYKEEYFDSVTACGDNIVVRNRNDSILKLNIENGNILSKEFMKYDRNWIDIILTQKGYVKKRMGQKGISLAGKKLDKPKWTYEFPNNETLNVPINKPIGSDKKNLYVSTEQGKLRAINLKNGKMLWEFDTYSHVTSNIVIGDGVLYLVNVTGQVIAIDANLKDGVQKWTNFRDR